MSDPSNDLFRRLEPPRGGLAGLRARLDRDDVRRGRRLGLQGAAATLALTAVVAAALLAPERPHVAVLDIGPARIRLGLAPEPTEPVSIPIARRGDLAAERVPVRNDRVVFYRIGSTTPSPELASLQ